MELQGVLTAQEEAQGFSLDEDVDVVLVLRHGEVLAAFSAHGATRESLREFLDRERAR